MGGREEDMVCSSARRGAGHSPRTRKLCDRRKTPQLPTRLRLAERLRGQAEPGPQPGRARCPPSRCSAARCSRAACGLGSGRHHQNQPAEGHHTESPNNSHYPSFGSNVASPVVAPSLGAQYPTRPLLEHRAEVLPQALQLAPTSRSSPNPSTRHHPPASLPLARRAGRSRGANEPEHELGGERAAGGGSDSECRASSCPARRGSARGGRTTDLQGSGTNLDGVCARGDAVAGGYVFTSAIAR